MPSTVRVLKLSTLGNLDASKDTDRISPFTEVNGEICRPNSTY